MPYEPLMRMSRCREPVFERADDADGGWRMAYGRWGEPVLDFIKCVDGHCLNHGYEKDHWRKGDHNHTPLWKSVPEVNPNHAYWVCAVRCQSSNGPAGAAWTGGMDADMPMAALVDHVLRHRDSPHRCLGLPRGVASACVRRRFHVLALRLHPDKTDHDAAAQAFAAVRDAAKELLQHQGQKTPR